MADGAQPPGKAIDKVTPQAAGAGRTGRWMLVLVAVWVVGLWQSAGLTLELTGGPDRFARIGQFERLPELVGDAELVGYSTDFPTSRETGRRRWLPQYAAVPAILAIAYNEDAALRMMRNQARRRGGFAHLYEYRRVGNFERFDARVQGLAGSLRCRLAVHEVAPRSVLYVLDECP